MDTLQRGKQGWNLIIHLGNKYLMSRALCWTRDRSKEAPDAGPKEASDAGDRSSEEKRLPRLRAGRVREMCYESWNVRQLSKEEEISLGGSTLLLKECVPRGHIRPSCPHDE